MSAKQYDTLAFPRSLADQARRSGVGHMSPTERSALRAYLATLDAKERIREAYGTAGRASDEATDEVWEVLGREPTASEYRAMAEVMREAAEGLEKEAGRVGK